MNPNEKAKHTPGPWKVGQEYSYTEDEIEAADGRAVALVWTRRSRNRCSPLRSDHYDDPELVANARLIAAAPELLEALQNLLAASVCADETGYAADCGFVDIEAIQQAAEDAIAKALNQPL